MKTFVIFDRKTGDILQTHVQGGEPYGGHQEILDMIRPGAAGGRVDVLEVEDLQPGTSYRVDVSAKKLKAVDETQAQGAGGAILQPVDGDPAQARTVYFDSREITQKKR